ncbi:S1 RNA-binding domain-containing protein [Rhodocytophaga rosea]|uniref:S1 RNA-binding domain-containing protein n=1 Tax=Rhodocytophaga rosea TaxID=2704465 RepID=A0A6C0GS87_9BACT|nr:S1 RNA-binding domain-containing protein [Rhodocytophaga rosea]QHT70965.1 S1 RNA-binding domain-containing protein [Rhodocytophaga rosea]
MHGKAEDFKEELLPERGSIIKTVIKNHIDDTLCLSVDQEDLKLVEEYQAFYQVIKTLKEGTITSGVVKAIVPFGIFVDLGYPYQGVVDIGHTDFNGGDRLPIDFIEKLKAGDTIQCIISYFRFDDRQIGLRWLENKQ